MQWITDRLKERTTLDGALMIAGGVVLWLIPATVVQIVAIVGVVYGAYTLLSKG
jgi:hypothetical protein